MYKAQYIANTTVKVGTHTITCTATGGNGKIEYSKINIIVSSVIGSLGIPWDPGEESDIYKLSKDSSFCLYIRGHGPRNHLLASDGTKMRIFSICSISEKIIISAVYDEPYSSYGWGNYASSCPASNSTANLRGRCVQEDRFGANALYLNSKLTLSTLMNNKGWGANCLQSGEFAFLCSKNSKINSYFSGCDADNWFITGLSSEVDLNFMNGADAGEYFVTSGGYISSVDLTVTHYHAGYGYGVDDYYMDDIDWAHQGTLSDPLQTN